MNAKIIQLNAGIANQEAVAAVVPLEMETIRKTNAEQVPVHLVREESVVELVQKTSDGVSEMLSWPVSQYFLFMGAVQSYCEALTNNFAMEMAGLQAGYLSQFRQVQSAARLDWQKKNHVLEHVGADHEIPVRDFGRRARVEALKLSA